MRDETFGGYTASTIDDASDTAVAVRRKRCPGEEAPSDYTNLTIEAEDRGAMSITNDRELYTHTDDAGNLSLISRDVYRRRLEALFLPACKNPEDELTLMSVPDDDLLRYIKDSSPFVKERFVYNGEYDDLIASITMDAEETADNSLHTLTIKAMRPHPSGAHAGTILTITENLLGRTESACNYTDSSAELVVSPHEGVEITVEDILNGEHSVKLSRTA